MIYRKWYTNPFVLVISFMSLTATALALLALLLLPQVSEIVDLMKWRMATARTFQVDTDIEWRGWKTVKSEAGNVTREPESVRLTTSGLVDRSDEETKQAHKFRAAIGAPDSTHVFEGEFRKLGEENYLKFDDVTGNLGTLRLDRFVDRWLQLQLVDVLEAVDLPFIGGGRPLSDEDKAYLAEEFAITPFISVVNRLQNDEVNGVTTLHYEVRPEVLFFKDFYMTEEKLRRGRELTETERRSIDRFFANIQPEIGEMWIGRGDYYLYRLRLRFRYDDGARDGVLSALFDFSHFNELVAVSRPEGDIENVKKIIDSLLPGIVNRLPMAALGGQRIATEDERRGGLSTDGAERDPDPDRDGLGNTLEFFYGSDPENPDTDGDGVSDGEEVENGMNPTGPGGLFDFGLSEYLK
ncbi:MAG: hypothetical protein U9Q03_05755 [Patescibacteria group bacterium]|nr:hypothetical protein [Patescibacteria group bacterium]